MEADDIVLEYLRGKLKKAQSGRAEAILKPPAPEAPPMEELPPEELAQLEALMGAEDDEIEE